MAKTHYFSALLGGSAAALLALIAGPTALGHAESPEIGGGGPYETCDGPVCLVMGNAAQSDWHYAGLRPFFTEWSNAAQAYTVQVGQGDGLDPITAGTYAMSVQDVWTPLHAVSHYVYGDFTANPDAPADLDLGGFANLSGASVYSISLFGGLISQMTIRDVQVHGHEMNYVVHTLGGFTNVVAYDDHDSADYFRFGHSDPIFLWNSLFHSWVPEVPEYVVPADPFSVPDFDPGDFLFDHAAG